VFAGQVLCLSPLCVSDARPQQSYGNSLVARKDDALSPTTTTTATATTTETATKANDKLQHNNSTRIDLTFALESSLA